MKPNLKIMLPLLAVILVVQFFLVRHFVSSSNEKTQAVVGEIDSSLPHPSTRYSAEEIVKVTLYSLKLNNLPTKDSGLKTLWQFFSPTFKQAIRDKALIEPFLTTEVLVAMKDYETYEIIRQTVSETEASFEVKFKSSNRLDYVVDFRLKNIEDLWLIERLQPLK